MRLLAALGLLVLLAGCGEDATNEPPWITIIAPFAGDRLTVATVVVADVGDDNGVARVQFFIGGELIDEVTTSPWEAPIPVGRWASGEPVELTATAWDSDGESTGAAPVTITIDPVLQTTPQLVSLAETGGRVRAAWLPFPAATSYTIQVSRSDGFVTLLLEEDLTATELVTDLVAEGAFYARVKAHTIAGDSPWSRSRRLAVVSPLVVSVPLARNQTGTLITPLDAGGYLILSREVARLGTGTVEPFLYRLNEDGTSQVGLSLMPSDDYRIAAQLPAAGPDLYLAGDSDRGGWVLRREFSDQGQIWLVYPDGMTPSALSEVAGGAVVAAGRDLLEDAIPSIAVVTLAAADGQETARVTVDLASDHVVTGVVALPIGYLLAGDLVDAEGGPAGAWVRRVDATGADVWNVRLGTRDAFAVAAVLASPEGIVLTGGAWSSDTARDGGWAAEVAVDGRLRWLTRETDWTEISAVAPSAEDRWLVAGRAGGELTFGELSSGGGWNWQRQLARGQSAGGFGIVRTAEGLVLVTGAQSDDGQNWDLLLVRTDDLGNL